jgi:hypothetical protein
MRWPLRVAAAVSDSSYNYWFRRYCLIAVELAAAEWEESEEKSLAEKAAMLKKIRELKFARIEIACLSLLAFPAVDYHCKSRTNADPCWQDACALRNDRKQIIPFLSPVGVSPE